MNALTLTTEYVDLEGLSADRDKQHIYGTTAVTDTGVIVQRADDVRLTNLLVEITRDSGGVSYDATDPAAYFPEGGENSTVVRNCRFQAASEDHAWSMRVITVYPGTFIDVAGGTYAFGGVGGTASGTFTRCTGGGGPSTGDEGDMELNGTAGQSIVAQADEDPVELGAGLPLVLRQG